MSTRAELLAELDALVGLGEARRDAACDPFLLGVRPAASDWMTADEIARMCDIQVALVPFRRDDMLSARERVRVKRARRRAALDRGLALL